MLAIRLALICVLLSFVSSAFAVIPPAGGAPAPTRVSVPTSSTTGTFSVTWAMAGSSELMSAQQTISKTGGTICPGDCTNIYEFQLEQSFNGGPFFQIYEGTAKIHQVHVSPGRYFYRVRAKEFNNRFVQYGEYTMSHQVIVEDDTPKSPENPVDFSFRVNDESSRIFTPSQQDLVGETAVNFRVNEAGAATMEVPIAVSAGIAQVTPNISLSYNSNNTRSSTLGTGWALNGISSITRCARTRIHDEPIEGIVDMSVSYDSNDRFCLDGQKLILMTGTYSGHGATYKTLKDSFETITSYTGSVNGPSYFKVKTKAGETKTYGTGNANNYPAGDSSVIKSWYLKSVKDVYNNGIYYNYKTEHDGKEFLVDYINYGSAADTNLGKVQFTYENKSKVSNGFFNGSEYKQTQRIDYITTYYQTNSTYRYYDLSYEVSPSSLHDRLTSIKECAATNVHCLTPLSFEWSDREIAFDTDSDMFLDASTSEMKNYSRFFDVNGDGITDHIYPESGHWNVKYGKTVGYMGDSVYLGSSNFYYTTDVAMQNAMVMDFNGDLKQDLLIPVKSGNSYKWYVIYHNPHNPLAPSECPGFGFNLFTRMKLSCLSYDNMAGTNFADKHLFTTPSLDVFIMDINGDGLQDFGYTSSGKLFIQTNGAGGEVGTFNTAYNAIHSDSMPQGAIPWKTTHVFSGAVSGFDANGDGAQDLVAYQYSNVCTSGWGEQCNNYSATYNWKLYLSDGHQLVSARSIVSSRSAIDKKQFGDFNGDGLSDLLYAGSDNKWRVAISDGKGFKSSISTAITQSHGNKVKVLDYDLDGRTDVLYWSNGWRIKNLSNGGTYFSYRNFMSNSGDVSGTDNGYSHITDMNGDGQPELLLLKNNSWIGFERDGTNEAGFSYVQESKWRSPNLIKSFSTRFGKTTAITYESSNDESVYTLGQEVTFPVVNLKPRYPLVSQVEKPDGIGGTNLVKYHYTGLRAHLLGHGLLGFAGVTSVDANNTLGVEIATTTTYNQGFNPNLVYQGKILTGSFSDWRKIGMPKETMVIAANGVKSAVLDESKNTTISYKERTPSSNSGSLVKPYFTYVAKSEDTKRTLDTSYHAKTGYLNPVDVSTTEHTKSYDNWGNVTQTTIAVTDSTLLETYTTTTNNYYGKTDASNRCGSNVTQGAFSQYTLYGRLTCSTVTKSRTGETAITTKAAFAYNSKGVLSEEESSPGTNLSKKTVRTYTSTGLLNRVTDYAKSFNPETGGYDTTSRYTQNYYDGTDKRFPSSIKNTLGHTVAYKYDSKLGKVKSETSNGLTKSYYYDAFASPIGTKSPITGKYTNINYYLCESSALCDVPSTQLGIDIVFAVEMLKSGSPTTIAYYDTFRRKVATRVAGFESGRYIYTGTIYDARGRITRTYAPSNFSPKKDYGKSFGYDLFDRPIWEMTKFDNRNIEGGATSSTTYIHYTGSSVKSVNTLGESTEHRNAMGEITSLDDKTGTGVITYAYYADGKLRKTTDVDNNEITLTYDIAGNKTQTDDPDMGVWQYKYNGFGEQTWQKDAKLQETWTYFDTIGRKTLRVDDAKGSGSSVRSSCWLYDSNFKGSLDKTRLMSGKKTSAQCKSNASSIEDKTYSYDDKNRPTGTYTKIKSLKEGTVSYYSAQYYNNVGKVAVKQSSYNEAVFYEFSSNGTPYRTRQASNNKLLHVIEATDEQGRVSRERSYVNGGSVLQTSTYNAGNGSLSERRASGRWGAISYQKFTFDRVGNLKQKVNQFDYNNDGILNASTEKYVEDYSYDNMNRVEQHSINNIGYEYFCYNNLGNITDKRRGSLNCASADTHTYKSDKPHQLHTFGGSTYYYDANGSVTSGGGRTIEYAAFGKPERISKSGTVVQFQYGANRSRFERVDTDSSGYIVTHYNAGAEHIYKNNIHETKFYENNLLITQLNGEFGYKALIKDHQGSVAAVVDELSFLEQHYRYDAFGKQYTLASKNASSATAVAGRTYNTQKGFTGHEMIASVGVIHMNGRIYDAVLGRFLQADPLIQAPNDSQSYNRYSYVRNNPLSLIDPTGYSWLGDLWDNIKPFVGLIVGVVGAMVCGPACAQLGWQIAAVGAVAGAAHAAANGGNIVTGALLGAFTAGAAKLGYIASAIAGGIASKVQGGKFHHGFWSAGLGSAFGGGFGTTNAAKILSSAIIGGTISKLTGGKFKNGAIGAAFATAMSIAADTRTDDEKWADANAAEDRAIIANGGHGLIAAEWDNSAFGWNLGGTIALWEIGIQFHVGITYYGGELYLGRGYTVYDEGVGFILAGETGPAYMYDIDGVQSYSVSHVDKTSVAFGRSISKFFRTKVNGSGYEIESSSDSFGVSGLNMEAGIGYGAIHMSGTRRNWNSCVIFCAEK